MTQSTAPAQVALVAQVAELQRDRAALVEQAAYYKRKCDELTRERDEALASDLQTGSLARVDVAADTQRVVPRCLECPSDPMHPGVCTYPPARPGLI